MSTCQPCCIVRACCFIFVLMDYIFQYGPTVHTAVQTKAKVTAHGGNRCLIKFKKDNSVWRKHSVSITNISVKSKLQHPPGHLTPLPSRGGGNLIIRGGEFDPHALGVGKLSCTLDFMWNLWCGELLFRGKDCAFVANCLRGKGLNKLCTVFEGIWILIFLILHSGFEYMNVKSSTEVTCFDLPHIC